VKKAECGCSCGEPLTLEIRRPASPSPVAAQPLGTTLTWRDTLGGWRVRWGIGRDRYPMAPGLYRVGNPDKTSPVLVTANYKLTVDALRRHLVGLDVWVLVLDTRGVNVWCAAGKGMFGTRELLRSIEATGLAQLVDHRRLIVPQLGAVGVAAHEVKKASGFSVLYGPVLARDIPQYLAAGMKATPAMRRVPFGWRERLVVAPMEIVAVVKPALVVLAVLFGLDLLRHGRLTPRLTADALPLFGALVAGSVLVPLLLPFLPSRSFAVKGAALGLAWAVAAALALPMGWIEAVGTALLVMAIVSFMAMHFTGATTFTNESGARLEVRRALPAIVAAAALGVALRVTAVFV
jgi:hypothetical protein